MKQIFYIASLIAIVIAIGTKQSQAQTFLYNGGTDITADIGSIIYVDGNVVNNTSGFIHNKGDIYLTGDWTNNEASGCLDPTTGTVWLYGNSQTIQGTQPTTFNNLNCENGGTKTLNVTTTYVGGNTGVLQLKNSPFDLNSKTLIVTNPASAAIAPPISGYIISETDFTAGYGIVQWNLGISTGNYVYPFGTTGGGYIPFIYNITTAGVQSTSGNISVATYPTNVTANPNNRPLPNGVTNLTNPFSGAEAAPVCADRYWPVLANNYSIQPTADVTFTYEDAEWDISGGSTNTIIEDSLRAWMWNGTQWQLPALGTDNISANTVFVSGLDSISASWTLKGYPPCAVLATITTATTTITLGSTVQITASGGGNYLWNTGETTASISVSPTSTTVYCVTTTDASGGCADSACISIKVELPCGDFFLPNAFSPNGDGKNDLFKPRNICIKDIDFKIYNRWGNLVFETTDITIGWDGSTPKGKNGNEGVYAYEITGHFNDGTLIDKKGTVTLMK
ncbi:MAG: gliding motility-associated C-terminal domain-containing protein [Bacteroidetes bacterium]|nr:gliding motility-associated C-terminal domain-containing protein [Bacteroidota bacterium]